VGGEHILHVRCDLQRRQLDRAQWRIAARPCRVCDRVLTERHDGCRHPVLLHRHRACRAHPVRRLRSRGQQHSQRRRRRGPDRQRDHGCPCRPRLHEARHRRRLQGPTRRWRDPSESRRNDRADQDPDGDLRRGRRVPPERPRRPELAPGGVATSPARSTSPTSRRTGVQDRRRASSTATARPSQSTSLVSLQSRTSRRYCSRSTPRAACR
jgi:hypothetical protein